MADNNTIVYQLNSSPGIQRDGTKFDSKGFIDGQWVRFQRGRPKKMGGYRQITYLNGPIRTLQTWSRKSLIQVTAFSAFGIEAVQVDKNGVGQAIYDRTPTAYTADPNAVWQADTMFDAAVDSDKTMLFAHAGSNLENIDNDRETDVYYGDAAGTATLTPIGITAITSGGILAIPPFLVLYGNDGKVQWSNENEPRTMTSGSAGRARVTGSKIVKGLPIRGQGASPAALLWSLDSVIRMSYLGGQAVFRFDVFSAGASILSSSSVIEYDGVYFWVGVDRFMMYDGRVRELPNYQNLGWFFDNLNFNHRQKVHATKVPRYGEIWWFFPKGGATECTHAVIYNVREQFWYDVEIPRSSGAFPQDFRYPIWADSENAGVLYRLKTNNVINFSVGDVVRGGTSGTVGTVVKVQLTFVYVAVNGPAKWEVAELVHDDTSGSSAVVQQVLTVGQHSLWMHEFGKNKVLGDDETGIISFVETANFGYPVGGVEGGALGPDRWTRLKRVEPDFQMTGSMNMQVIGGETAAGTEVISKPYRFNGTTERIDLREQRREIRLRFTSDETNGDFEMGKVLMHLEQGDVRS